MMSLPVPGAYVSPVSNPSDSNSFTRLALSSRNCNNAGASSLANAAAGPISIAADTATTPSHGRMGHPLAK